ncbi:hypothetical protein D3C71_1643330 [compost metagenome]
MKPVIERFQVDIGSTQIGHAPDDGVDQSNDGRFAREILQMLNKISAVGPITKAVILITCSFFNGLHQSLLNV